MAKKDELENNSITRRRRELFTDMENQLKNMGQYTIPDNVKSSGSSRKFGKGNIAAAQNNVTETQSMPEKISPKKKNYLATIPEPSMSSPPVNKMSDPKNNKPLMKITSGPRKGTQYTLSGNKVTPIKEFGSMSDVEQFESGKKATGFQAGETYRTPTGLDITPGEGLNATEMLGLMRTPVHGGTRRRSNLAGKYDRIETDNSAGRFAPEQEDPRRAKLWEIAENSRFPRQRTAALKGLELMESDQQFDTTFDETQRQFDLEEGRTITQNDITNQQRNRELDISQQRANADERYKEYLALNQNNDNALTKNQYLNQDSKVQNWYENQLNVQDNPMKAQQPNNWMDSDMTTPIDRDMMLYRERPDMARKFLGEPSAEMKAKVDLNASPNMWLEYINATPAERQQLILNTINKRGY